MKIGNRKRALGTSKKLKFLLCAFCAMLLDICDSSWAQQPPKLHRIGYLSPLDPVNDALRSNSIRQALREVGYIEGQNIMIEYQYAHGQPDRLPELAAELVRRKVDIIIVSGGDRPIRAAKNATKTIPIIMAGQGADPVEAGYVQSLARPGGNVTGVTNIERDLAGKRIELLKETAPKISRVAVLYDPAVRFSVREVKESLPLAANTLGLQVRSWEIPDADAFDKVLAALDKDRPHGIYVPAGGTRINANSERVADFSLQRRIPSLYGNRDAVDAGGLMYYGADLSDSHRRVAIYVDKVLRGAKPADLPVEQPTKFELVFNLKTAKQIGITIPQRMLARADRVVK